MGLMRDDQSSEIFDDLYLGLRAGGALRKQRRGEELTEEELPTVLLPARESEA